MNNVYSVFLTYVLCNLRVSFPMSHNYFEDESGRLHPLALVCYLCNIRRGCYRFKADFEGVRPRE